MEGPNGSNLASVWKNRPPSVLHNGALNASLVFASKTHNLKNYNFCGILVNVVAPLQNEFLRCNLIMYDEI